MKNEFTNTRKVVILGAGGGAGYYIAKTFLLADKTVQCFDINSNSLTKELETLGANITYNNPDDYSFPEADQIIYTRALPKEHIDLLFQSNDTSKIEDSGTYYNRIVDKYAAGEFDTDLQMKNAIKQSEIAPLYNIDFGNCILIGVTGSKGKTTVAHMIYETLYHLGAKISCVTTIGAKVRGENIETGLHTSTPSAQELAKLFKAMLKKGSEIIVLEATSHAIATGRIAGLKFDIGIITNLQPEHLDFHKTIDHIISTKKKLVTEFLKPQGSVILNIDDENISKSVLPDLNNYPSQIFTVSQHHNNLENTTEFVIENIEEKESAVDFTITSRERNIHKTHYSVPYAGSFNTYNILPSVIIADILGYNQDFITESVKKLGVVSGRNEIVQELPFKVILDFAHTPESLEAILKTYKSQTTNGRIIVLFGAAGQRDSFKRPRMGEIAAKYADIAILTAEDPRTEKLSEINAQIKEGWDKYVEKHNLQSIRALYLYDDITLKEKCRTEAIRKAIEIAEPGDTVICAGKGPEKSICIGFEEIPWDEKSAIKAALSYQK